ncbi:CRTAC1 family protein [Stieleria sp. JC731]|uniref:CRTAC1 family protein n=1 Tax=Pirellulaceae TaxID=2691357 RepID=UPI001E54153C|nr:CRTAC1 family protein [Stieleria sp. JC731]MCC9602837.1 CRTAC1 family protein [Stieleria sp. JC731]
MPNEPDPVQRDDQSDKRADLQDDVQDDAVIGTALRASLLVFVFAMIPVIFLLVYLNLTKKEEVSVEIEAVAPEGRKVDTTSLPEIKLVDVTEESGISFTHYAGKRGEKLLPETMGSGVGVFDYDNDGHQDIFFVNSRDWPWAESPQTATCRLYRGDGKFNFTDVTEQAGLDLTLYGMGVAVGDYDNDGDRDLYISAVGSNKLMRNEGGKFVDVTEEAQCGGSSDAWSTSSCFLDYDNDGRLDLFVCNYVTWNRDLDLSQTFSIDGESRSYGPPNAFEGAFSYLYHNEGDGKFKDVSESAGIQQRSEDTNVVLGKAMGVIPVDVNRDGFLDIVVANDTVRNFLFENQKDGTFKEVGRLSGIAYDLASGNARGAMGIDAAIFRDDGTIAIGIGNFANEASALYMASPRRSTFVDAAMYTGFGPPTRLGLTFGLFFFDADLDGRLDIFGANGHLEEEIEKTQRTLRYAQPPQLFWNAGRDAQSELVLLDVNCTGESFCEPIVGRGATYGDFDEDGDQDIVIAVSDGPAKVFRNDQSSDHHYVRFRLTGTETNRDAIGTQVTVVADGQKQTRVVSPTRSYLSQSEIELTFGLGEATKVDSVEVVWPGKDPIKIDIDGIDRLIEIEQPSN